MHHELEEWKLHVPVQTNWENGNFSHTWTLWLSGLPYYIVKPSSKNTKLTIAGSLCYHGFDSKVG